MELINIVGISPLISKCQIKVCWVGEQANRNRSIITKEVATEMAPTLRGCPIVGHWCEEKEDFDRHNTVVELKNGEWTLRSDTVPFGFVDLNAKLWFDNFTDPDGVIREYLCTEGWLWTEQFPECARVLEKGNGQSMELSGENLKGNWTKDVNGNLEFFIINEATISKLCILGEDVEPCFEGANITAPKIEFSLGDDFKTKLYSMMTEIKKILEEGGTTMEENKVVEEPVVEETPVVEEPPITEETPVTEEPVVEEIPKDEPAQYNLEEIPEYIELKNSYSTLETQYNELKTSFEAANNENTTLKEFKASIEKKEKENMINSFYMLSEEDKKDVIDNIDTYSLNDIEAKLSIICVRNKVNFNLDNEENAPTTYSLDSVDADLDETPDWIKAVQAVTKEN